MRAGPNFQYTTTSTNLSREKLKIFFLIIFPKMLDFLWDVWYISITKGEGTAKPKWCDPRESVRPIPHDPTARSLRCAVYKCEPIPRVY